MMLKGREAIITGAARGIGAALAVGYAKEGAKLVIADIVDGDETVAEVSRAGSEGIFVKTDVTRQDQCDAMARAAADRFGSIDIIVNNAAMYANIIKKPFAGLLLSLTQEDLKKDIGIHQIHYLHSSALCCNSTAVNLSLNSDNPSSQSNLNLFVSL